MRGGGKMTSIRFLVRTVIVGLAIAAAATAAIGAVEKTDGERDRLFQERSYLGKPLVYWLNIIRSRNEEGITLAFDAVRSLGPDGWIAVPDLTRLIAAPFSPIEIGMDSQESVAAKLYDIAVRAEAIDTLAWMGESGSPAALSLIRWALAERIIPDPSRNPDNDELFVELVIVDAEQRMRVAGAIAQFGPDASPMIAALLSATNPAKRKLGVAILSEGALPIAAELLHSRDCEDQKLGFLILEDMDLVVAQSHLDELKKGLGCSRLANNLRIQKETEHE
jgi:hypothetical protein